MLLHLALHRSSVLPALRPQQEEVAVAAGVVEAVLAAAELAADIPAGADIPVAAEWVVVAMPVAAVLAAPSAAVPVQGTSVAAMAVSERVALHRR